MASFLPTTSKEVRNTGITVLWEPDNKDDVVADIVFVHGLRGHPRNTWTWKDSADQGPNSTHIERKPDKLKRKLWFRRSKIENSGSNRFFEEKEPFWPFHFLPIDCPNARILTWGYDSEISKFFSGATNQNNIFAHSRDLLEDLSWERRSNTNRPLIFVAHSLGGIIVKELLLRANDSDDDKQSALLIATLSILFLGTPHRGSTYADMGETVRRVIGIVGFDTANQNLRTLEIDGALLENCDERFQKLRDRQQRKFEVHTFQEGQGLKGSSVLGLNEKVVRDFSSSFPLETSKVSINANHMSMVRFLSIEDDGYRKIIRKLQEPCDNLAREGAKQRLDDGTKGLELNVTDECLQTLYFAEMEQREAEIRQSRTTSCKWIFESETYQQWLQQKRNILWIKGKPGSGKSTLMKRIFQHLQADDSDDKIACLSYFFNRRGSELQHSELGMLQTLLYQLLKLSPEAGIDFQSLYEEKSKLGNFGTAWKWTMSELRHHLKNVFRIAAKSRPFRLCVDALDEGGVECAQTVVAYLCDLNGESSDTDGFASICFSCRHYPILAINDGLNICVEDENERDIATYTSEELRRRLATLESDNSKDIEILVAAITQNSLGVFLWAALIVPRVVEHYNEGKLLDEILKNLDSVPGDLDEVYRHILTQVIQPSVLKKTLQLMRIITFAFRPLSLSELRLAIAYEDEDSMNCVLVRDLDGDINMKRRVLSLSGGLVEFQKTIDAVGHEQLFVQFIHQSVIDFMNRGGFKYLEGDPNSNTVGEAHVKLAKSSLNCLMANGPLFVESCVNSPEVVHTHPKTGRRLLDGMIRRSVLKDILGGYMFLEYATDFCLEHAARAEAIGVVESVLPTGSLASKFLDIYLNLQCYSAVISSRKFNPTNVGLLHLCAWTNLFYSARLLINDGANVDAKDFEGNSPLHTAAVCSSLETAEELLKAGASVTDVNRRAQTPLFLAASHGFTDLVALLLKYGSPLSRAALEAAVDVESIPTVQLLLDNDLNQMPYRGLGDAFFIGIRTSNFNMFQLLLERFVIDANADYLHEALCAAAGENSPEIVRCLIERGAIASSSFYHKIKPHGHESPLHAAIIARRPKNVRILLQHGADVSMMASVGTPLELAKKQRNTEIQHLLLEFGANPSQDIDFSGDSWSDTSSEDSHYDAGVPPSESIGTIDLSSSCPANEDSSSTSEHETKSIRTTILATGTKTRTVITAPLHSSPTIPARKLNHNGSLERPDRRKKRFWRRRHYVLRPTKSINELSEIQRESRRDQKRSPAVGTVASSKYIPRHTSQGQPIAANHNIPPNPFLAINSLRPDV